MNPFNIGVPCINIARSKVLFEQKKYDVGVQNYDAIKRDQIFFDFMKWTFNPLDGLYIHENVSR